MARLYRFLVSATQVLFALMVIGVGMGWWYLVGLCLPFFFLSLLFAGLVAILD